MMKAVHAYRKAEPNYFIEAFWISIVLHVALFITLVALG